MLVVGIDEVCHVSEVVVSYAQKVPIWVSRVFLIVSSINNEFLTDFVESMFYIVRWEIIGKWVISGK